MRSRVAALAIVGAITLGAPTPQAQAESASLPKVEAGFGTLLGSYAVGKPKGFAGGIYGDVGVRVGPFLRLGLEYDLLRVGDNDSDEHPVQGTLNRLGVTARYSVLVGGSRDAVVSIFFEGGIGRENVSWDDGGELSRRSITFGFGAQPMFSKLPESSERGKSAFGYSISFRGFLANDPGDALASATCAGPCDRPTRGGHDLGFFFNWAFTFGR